MTEFLPPGSATCFCNRCGDYFASVYPFDLHLVGEATDLRCLTEVEMLERGMSRNVRGHWVSRAMTEEEKARAKQRRDKKAA